MRILYHHRILARDGMRVHVDALVDALRRQGHAVAIEGPGERDIGAAAGRQPSTSPSRLQRLRGALPGWLRDILELAYNLTEYPRLHRAARAHGAQAIYERYNLYLLSGLWARRQFGIPLLLEVNAPLVEERGAAGALGLPALARWAERRAWRSADAVLPVSRQIADRVRRAGVPESRIWVQPNAVHRIGSAGGPGVRQRLGLGDSTVIGFVGFARGWHRLDRVLDVLGRPEGRDLRLLVIGDGPARPELEARAEALGVADRLRITGALSHAETAAHLDAVDVALQPDVTPYASPLKVFEYMAAGRAIAAPRRENIEDILDHGSTALLFDPQDDRSFTDTVLQLAGDPELRARLGAAAQAEIARRGHTWDANAERVATIAENLAHGRAAPQRAGEAAETAS